MRPIWGSQYRRCGTGGLGLGEREQIVAAGWTTDRKTIYRRSPADHASCRRSRSSSWWVHTCVLFWRRDCLSACLEAGIGHGVEAAQLAIGYALQACGIECRTAETSYLLGEPVAFAAPTNSAIAWKLRPYGWGRCIKVEPNRYSTACWVG